MKALQQIAFALLLMLLAAGCRSKGTRVSYLLRCDDSLKAVGGSQAVGLVSVKKVDLPAYLRRRSIVQLREGGDVLGEYADKVWAEDFERSVKRVLEENLSLLLPAGAGASERSAVTLEFEFKHFELDESSVLHVGGVCKASGGERLDFGFELKLSDYANPSRAHGAALSRISVQVAEWLVRK